MGDLILLDQRREAHRRRRGVAEGPGGGAGRRSAGRRGPALSAPRTTFFFDLACPLSYLAAERVERTLGDAHWVPVSAGSLFEARAGAAPPLEELREPAEHWARRLKLPLVWPERFPAQTPLALRAAAHAAEVGAGAAFALAASRLAFCGGFDLDDPETLAEAAAAAGVPLEDCLAAAADPARDQPLQAAARRLRARGVRRLPALGLEAWGRPGSGDAGEPRFVQGESPVFTALDLLRNGRRERPLAPAG